MSQNLQPHLLIFIGQFGADRLVGAHPLSLVAVHRIKFNAVLLFRSDQLLIHLNARALDLAAESWSGDRFS